MTNAIEQTRREMYDHLASVKASVTGISTPMIYVKRFEEFLEAHLEELRKAMVTINESTVSCAQHSAEAFLDLETRMARMTEERDELRNKLQAFEFANRSAAELLSEALREPSGLRKSSQAIPHQESTEKAVCERCNGSGRIFAGLLWGVSEPLTVQCSCVSRNK